MTFLNKGAVSVVSEQHTQPTGKIWLALTSCFSSLHCSVGR